MTGPAAPPVPAELDALLRRMRLPYLRKAAPDVLATACFYATDIHRHGLGKGMNDNSLERAGEIKGELLHIWGRQDPHIPLEGRNLIHARLEEVGARFQWIEVNGQHAFLRDEGPRSDQALARLCYEFVFELFHRRLG